jgi:hypothetical protein
MVAAGVDFQAELRLILLMVLMVVPAVVVAAIALTVE